MIGIKQKESKLFYNFSLSSRIPKDHFLRKLEEAVDFSAIRRLAKPYYSHTGQPSIDPVVLIKMMLIGYLYNITSERKLAQELKVNLAFMYFLGYDIDEETPNHSILSKARRRFSSKIFEEFFHIVIERCKEHGLICAEKAFLDSTIVPADASLSSIVDCDEKIILKRSPKDYLKTMDELNPIKDDKEPPQQTTKPKANQSCLSKTDPDASIIRHKNKPPQLAYKQHISIDNGSAKIITSCTTTPAATADEHKLPFLVSKAYQEHNILPKDIGADTKYGTADNYRFLLESHIKPSIPHHGGKNATGLSTKDNFSYDKEKDQYTCPQGKILKNRGFSKKQRHFVYRANPKDCKACNLLRECTKSPAGRSVTRHVNEPFLEQAKEHLKTPSARATIKQRTRSIEAVFACEKKDLGLKRAKFRGLVSVHIQSMLTATAYNLKKLVKYSKGFKQKLKTAPAPPILTMPEANAVNLGRNTLVTACSVLKNSTSLFIKHILGLKFAYNVT
ncbi:transposase [Candidatus Omnitrophota bacterium]